MLKCETNTPEVKQDITNAFSKSPHRAMHDEISVDFEHGQWFVLCLCGAGWSVHDAEGVNTFDGFDFEEVGEGDDSYHVPDDDQRSYGPRR